MLRLWKKALHVSFLAAIVVDSYVDEFLIGITGAAGQGATIVMAGSLSVEMSFVGLTLATAITACPIRMPYPWPWWDRSPQSLAYCFRSYTIIVY